MISPRKLAANRANARASTGPRTPSGKSRVARNALRHGLSLPVMSDPAMVPALEALVAEMVGGEEDPGLRACATAVAEAQLDLVRIRRLHHEVLTRTVREPTKTGGPDGAGGRAAVDPPAMKPMLMRIQELGDKAPEGLEKRPRIPMETLQTLVKMDRYERRALSRRKFAIREFDAALAANKAAACKHRVTPRTQRPRSFRITVRAQRNIPLDPHMAAGLLEGGPVKIKIVASSEVSWTTSNLDDACLNELKRQLDELQTKLNRI